MRIPIILAVAALALAGCNANQERQSLVAYGLPSLGRPIRGDQSLRSHQLRAEQHRARRRRPLRAGWHMHISRNSFWGKYACVTVFPVFPVLLPVPTLTCGGIDFFSYKSNYRDVQRRIK